MTVKNKVYSNSGNTSLFPFVKDNTEILDVGCGNGDNARYFKSRGCKIDGITLSEEEAVNCEMFMENIYIFNLENGLPDLKNKKYDYIICSHVLEHIAYPNKLLNDILLSLKHDGQLIVALPNIMHYKSRFTILKGNFPQSSSGIWDDTHLKWYTFNSGKELLERNGFNVLFANVDGDIPLLTLFNIFPHSFRKSIFKILKFISKGFFGGQLIYVANKA